MTENIASRLPLSFIQWYGKVLETSFYVIFMLGEIKK